jgi:hypothetical protein
MSPADGLIGCGDAPRLLIRSHLPHYRSNLDDDGTRFPLHGI